MAQTARRVPQRTAQTELMERLQSEDPRTRTSAMQDLVLYLHETLNPPNRDNERYFPVLRAAREMRERATEGERKTGLDMRYWSVLRLRQRLDTVLGYVPALIERLGDGDAQVRGAAAYTLGLIGDSRAYDALRRLSERDPSEIVRNIANTSLQLIPPPETRRK